MHQYTGNIHIHSTHSDGHASFSEIARAAKSAGLDFIIITDHNTLRGLDEEGYYDGVLVLAGSEINVGSHHYLALNINRDISCNEQNPQQVIDQVSRQGGLGFIAHPFEKGSPLVLQNKHYPWSSWDVAGYTGMEVWNWGSQWRDGVRNIFCALYYSYIHPASPIKGPCPQAMTRFDQVTAQSHAVAIAGTDIHAVPIRWGPFRRVIFPYSFMFRTVNNCLLLDNPLSTDFAAAKAQVYDALRRGRLFIVNSMEGDATGFSFTVTNEEREYQMGEAAPLQEITGLRIQCPHKFRGRLKHRIYHNGRILDEIPRCNVTIRIYDPGTYRLEVYHNKKPWIFTNPVYIT